MRVPLESISNRPYKYTYSRHKHLSEHKVNVRCTIGISSQRPIIDRKNNSTMT